MAFVTLVVIASSISAELYWHGRTASDWDPPNGLGISGGALVEWKRAEEAELSPIRFHDLRQTCASLMLADGEPLTTVSAILGHRSPVITAMIYAHAVRGQTDDAIARHAERLRKGA